MLISLNRIYCSAFFLTDTDCVLCEVGTEFLYVIQMDLPLSVGLHRAAPWGWV